MKRKFRTYLSYPRLSYFGNAKLVMKKKSLGFTLIELLVASTILAVLASVGLVSFTSANQRARDGKRKADLEQMRAALELYRTANNGYPAANNTPDVSGWTSASNTLLTSTYLSTTLVDPKNVSPQQYKYGDLGTTTSYNVCVSFETGNASGSQPGFSCNGTQCCLSNP